jgi:prepilin-type N-terminal cleavage/methylation domain-containing protein
MIHCARRAFTIIELLVVIAIISILITLGFVVAGKVSGSGKHRVTEQTLNVLEQALAALTAANGGMPPPTVTDPRPGGANNIIAIVDGKNMSTNPATVMNSVGLFMLQCKNVPDAAAKLKDLDTKLVREFDPDQTDSNPQAPSFNEQPQLLTAFDGWGNPIRYVHPMFKGRIAVDPSDPASLGPVQVASKLGPAPAGKFYRISDIRRTDSFFSQTDSDGGMPIGQSPYFYSCGPDGDPATIEDNVYTKDNRPRFPK